MNCVFRCVCILNFSTCYSRLASLDDWKSMTVSFSCCKRLWTHYILFPMLVLTYFNVSMVIEEQWVIYEQNRCLPDEFDLFYHSCSFCSWIGYAVKYCLNVKPIANVIQVLFHIADKGILFWSYFLRVIFSWSLHIYTSFFSENPTKGLSLYSWEFQNDWTL